MNQFSPPQEYVFFADESSISGERYTLVAGVCVKSALLPELYKNIASYREQYNMAKELKWSKVTDQKLAEYQEFVELFFALNHNNKLWFHWTIYDNHVKKHKHYSDGSKMLGLSAIYHHFFSQTIAQYYSDIPNIAICLDRRQSRTPLEDLRKEINGNLANRIARNNLVKQLISKDSKQDDVLQLNDVVLGAVSAIRNGRHKLAEGRAAKKHLAQLVSKKSGLEFEEDSQAHVKRFTINNVMQAKK